MAAPEQGSPLWRLERLAKRLNERQAHITLMSRYYEGDHPLPLTEENVRKEFMRLLTQSRANWTGLIVEALAERLHVDGFRLTGEQEADDDAWAIWQANELDADSELTHIEALVCGESYVSVWANPDDPEMPLITPEHPSQMIVEPDRTNRRLVGAALKVWNDDWTGERWATLYLPDRIYKYRAPGAGVPWPAFTEGMTMPGGVWRERDESLPNPLGVVPVVPFRNKPRLLTGGRSEIADLTDIQDRINKTLFDRAMASEYSSYRQRYVIGLEISYDANGQPKEPFKHRQDRLWQAEDPAVQFGEFSATDLGPYIASVASDVQHMAAISRTPPHYLLGQIVNVSGDALKAAEAGLSSKAASRTRHFGEAWEKVIRLGFAVLDDPRAKVTDSQVIWHDVETRTEGERVDALTKMATLGVPRPALWERWGASQQEIERWRGMQVTEALTNQGVDVAELVP